jgi:hypothetical protein
MSRFAQWRAAPPILLGVLTARAAWLAWQYYFDQAPRYRVESAMIALVIAVVALAVMRRGESPPDNATPVLPLWWPCVFVAAAVALYARAIGLGFLSDDYALRSLATRAAWARTSAGSFVRCRFCCGVDSSA